MSREWRPERNPRFLGRGALTSLLVHSATLFPLLTVAFIFGAREAARRADEVEMTFEEVSEDELPENLPSIEPEVPEAPAATAKKKAREVAAKKPQPKPEPEIQAPKPEELPKIAEQPPEEKPQPKPPEPPKQNQKMVDLDNDKEVEPPPDAKYLAQKNNRAEQETRADRTNLEREQKGEKGSSPSENKDEDVGDDKDKIAELRDNKSKLGRRAPDVTPHQEEALTPSTADKPKSLLSMRQTERQRHQIAPETVDPALPRDPDGFRALPEENLQSMKDLLGRSGEARRMSLKLSGRQYEYLYGDDAAAAERFAQKERSKKKGRFAERQDRVRSALENFIPEVQPGNQTALNTRAAPFAAFITRMHRSIHKLWGFGFLEDLDSKPASNPYNNPDLVTKLEIVLNGDGTVDKVTVFRPSGYLPFDAAAIDIAYSAGPYPDPPRDIRSANGKIYVHWTFHRDQRACGTAGVDYFILNNAAPGGDKGEAAGAQPGPSPAHGPEDGHNHGKPSPPALRPMTSESGPRRLERELEAPALGREEPGAAELEATRRATAQVARADNAEARGVAERFFDGYSRGDVARMVAQASFPFRSKEGVAADSAGALSRVLRDLLAETPGQRAVRSLQLYSAGGLRGALGSLPPGFTDGAGLLYAVAIAGGDTFVLVMAPERGAWRAVGLVRR